LANTSTGRKLTKLPLLWLVLVVQRRVGPVVWLLVALMLGRLVWSARGRGQALASAAVLGRRAALLSSGRVRTVLAAVLAAALLPFVLPWSVRARGEFRVEAAPRTTLHAEGEGVLDRLHVEEGATVAAGAVLASLWNPDLERERLATRRRLDLLRLAHARAGASGDRTAGAAAAAPLAALEMRLAVLDGEHARLTVRAPQNGIVVAHRLRERAGEWLPRGAPLFEIAAAHGRIARVRVPLARSAGVVAGRRASLKLSAWPDLTFVSQVRTVSPAAREGWLEAEVALPEGPVEPAPGMVGVAKILIARGTVAGALVRAFRENVRLDVWL
jgi:multidrug efflux pump subunit AcrA (membrane-fusion protein)